MQVWYFSVLKYCVCKDVQCSVIFWKCEKVLKRPLFGYGLKKDHIYFVKLELWKDSKGRQSWIAICAKVYCCLSLILNSFIAASNHLKQGK